MTGANPGPVLRDAAGHLVEAADERPIWIHVGAPVPDCPVIATWRALVDEPDPDMRYRWRRRGRQLALEDDVGPVEDDGGDGP